MRVFLCGLLLACLLFSLLGAVAQQQPDDEITKLIAQLASTDVLARQAALARAAGYHDTRLFPALKALLADDNPLFRAQTAQTVASCYGPTATPLIIPLLKDEFLTVRSAAMEALGATRDLQVIPLLLACANDPKAEARMQAVSGLGTLLCDLRDKAGVVEQLLPALFTLKDDAEPAISSRAEQKLQALIYKSPSSAALQDIAVTLLRADVPERTFSRLLGG